jgi:hypothetical protein
LDVQKGQKVLWIQLEIKDVVRQSLSYNLYSENPYFILKETMVSEDFLHPVKVHPLNKRKKNHELIAEKHKFLYLDRVV